MKILYLTSWLPFPLNTGARVRNYHLIKNLSARHQIDLISFISKKEEITYATAFKDICQKIDVVLAEEKKYTFFENITGFLSEKPKSIKLSFNMKLAKLVFNWTTEKKYDLIVIENLMMAQYVLDIVDIPRVFDHHNVDAVIIERDYLSQSYFLNKIRRWLTWKKAIGYEMSASSKLEAHMVVSSVDKNIFLKLIPSLKLLEVIPNGVDLNSFFYHSNEDGQRDLDTIIFSSLLKYTANLDGLRLFCEKIFPIIKDSRPDIKLMVTGDYSDLPVEDLHKDKNIKFVGYVDNVKKVISKASVTVVPLKTGSGTRFKILESMALGTPVVSTSIGAEGIEGLKPINGLTINNLQLTIDNFNIWITDDPEDFAKGVITLLSNKELAGILSRNGRRLIEERYSWDNIGKKMDEFIEKVVNSQNSVS